MGVQESCAPRQARQADLQARRLARRSGSASSSSEDSSPELKSGVAATVTLALIRSLPLCMHSGVSQLS